MVEFVKFWYGCFLEGLHVGDHVFTVIESACIFIGACLHWHDKIPYLKKYRDKWKTWEEKAMKWAVVIFLTTFLFATFCVAPFIKFHESEEDTKKSKNETASWTNRALKAESQLADSKQTKFDQDKEQEKKYREDLSEALQEQRKLLFSALTNRDPVRAMVSFLTDPDHRAADLNPTNPSDLTSISAGLEEELSTLDARANLDRLKNSEADSIALEKYSHVFDYAIKRLNFILEGVASENTDRIKSSCTNFLDLLRSTNSFIEFKNNEDWKFKIAYRGNGNGTVSVDFFCSGGTSSTIQLHTDVIETRFNLAGRGLPDKDSPISKYKEDVDALLNRLVAAQQRAVPIHK